MQPRSGMPESFRDDLRQRWEAGCRHGRTLLAQIRKLGYVGCDSGLAKFLSPCRQAKTETRRAVSRFPDASQLEPTITTGSRQLSPQVAAALLSKVRAELTSQQTPSTLLSRGVIRRWRPSVSIAVKSRPVKTWGPVDGRGQAMFGWPMEEEAELEFTITVNWRREDGNCFT
jgi:hypothetical protein